MRNEAGEETGQTQMINELFGHSRGLDLITEPLMNFKQELMTSEDFCFMKAIHIRMFSIVL